MRATNIEAEINRDCWATPPDFWRWVEGTFAPEIDACALASNAKCERFITPEMDALGRPWDAWTLHPRTRFWCNPGYSNITPWAEMAIEAALNGHEVFMLTHDNWSAPWFLKLWEASSVVYLLTPRIYFVPPKGVKASSPSRCNTLFHVTQAHAEMRLTGYGKAMLYDWSHALEQMNRDMEGVA